MAKGLRMGQRRRNKHWVNVYWPDKAFGGHEEGGWWYNYGICREAIPHRSRKQAEKLVAQMLTQPWYQNSGKPLYSVNHSLGDTVRIEIADYQGQDWSDYSPWE